MAIARRQMRRFANRDAQAYVSGMTGTNPTHPFTLDIHPCPKPAGHFGWAIRKHGKLLERSDRPHPSERSARERGEAALDRQIRGERQR